MTAPVNDFEREVISRLKSLQQDGSGMFERAPEKIPLIDPTANVLSLVAAESRRQDDLRRAEFRRIDDLRALETNCSNELKAAESKRIDMSMLAESRRIDALLGAFSSAVALASQKADANAATLAAQVVTSANAITAQTTQLREAFDKRITLLEQNQYQGVGATGQRAEGRQHSQWVLGFILAAAIFLSNILSKLFAGK